MFIALAPEMAYNLARTGMLLYIPYTQVITDSTKVISLKNAPQSSKQM